MAGPLSYLAGLIDGEGCISFYRAFENKAKNKVSFRPRLGISSKDKWFLEKLKVTYGGNVCKGGKGMLGTQMWDLRFSPNEARQLLPDLIPNLILKKREAILLLEGLMLTLNHRESYHDSTRLNEIVDELKILKKDRRAA